MLDPRVLRRQFPVLAGSDAAYLDTAATAQKPEPVLRAMDDFLRASYGPVHRGLYPLAERATAAYEAARETVRGFLGAAHADEIVFTRGTTEAINLVARSYGSTLHAGDAVIVTRLDHHANILPWLQLKAERGVEVRWLDLHDEGSLKMDEYERLLADGRVRLAAVTGQSNVLGVRPDIRRMADMAREAGARLLVDAAQLAVHGRPDVSALGADFLVFSGHKTYGPTGIGALYGRRELLRAMPPFMAGGMMLKDVTDEGFVPDDPPARFEAGTPPVTEAVGLAAALEWMQGFDPADVRAHEASLLARLLDGLGSVKGVRVLAPGDAGGIHGCVSFVVDGVHAHDVAEVLGKEGICIRAGHHCAQPLHRRLGVIASARVSVALHTTPEEIDRVAPAVEMAVRLLSA